MVDALFFHFTASELFHSKSAFSGVAHFDFLLRCFDFFFEPSPEPFNLLIFYFYFGSIITPEEAGSVDS